MQHDIKIEDGAYKIRAKILVLMRDLGSRAGGYIINLDIQMHAVGLLISYMVAEDI